MSVGWQPFWDRAWTLCLPFQEDQATAFRLYETVLDVTESKEELILFLLHGGGMSAMSFAALALELKQHLLKAREESASLLGAVSCRIIAFDARGHGHTILVTTGSVSESVVEEHDARLGLNDMTDDANRLIIALFGKQVFQEKYRHDVNFSLKELNPTEDAAGPLQKSVSLVNNFDTVTCLNQNSKKVRFIIVGHSMGAPVAVQLAMRMQPLHLVSIVVIDVVEGTAKEAMPVMRDVLKRRPASFQSPDEAISWTIQHGTVKNGQSANVSVPSTLKWIPPPTSAPSNSTPSALPPRFRQMNRSQNTYVWRTPLSDTASYWSEWFLGLSNNFLSCRTAKMLILAGTDRLDQPLTIAQMQGRFQLEVVFNTGHAVHEDDPSSVAQLLAKLWQRHWGLILPPKVGTPGAFQNKKIVA